VQQLWGFEIAPARFANCKNVTVAERCYYTVVGIALLGQAKQSRSRQTRDCAAQESPGDRVPAAGAFH
jgi:hypothetical protein